MPAPSLKDGYRTAPEIRARLAVLYEKADRVTVYNQTLNAAVLDAKQLKVMHKRGRVPGRDLFPPYLHSLGSTIDRLQTRLKSLGEPQLLRPVADITTFARSRRILLPGFLRRAA